MNTLSLINPSQAQRVSALLPVSLAIGLLLGLTIQGISLMMLAQDSRSAPQPDTRASLTTVSQKPDSWLPESDDRYRAAIEPPVAPRYIDLPREIDITDLPIPGHAMPVSAMQAGVPGQLTDAATAQPEQRTTDAVKNDDIAAPDTWFENANRRHYTLQRVSARNGEAVAGFYAAQTDTAPLALLRLNIKDATWFAVISGDYPDLDSAKAAADAYLQRTGNEAWIRRFAAIQDEYLETVASTGAGVPADAPSGTHSGLPQ